MEQIDEKKWSDLPEHVILCVFKCLNREDQLKAALTCQGWHRAFVSPLNWKIYIFKFINAIDCRHIHCVEMYGRFLRKVIIELDQYEEKNRENTCTVIKKLADCDERRLENLMINCIGRNPLFYGGIEFIIALQYLFGVPPQNVTVLDTLKWVDLSGLPFLLDDMVLNMLAINNPLLQYLNIQNSAFVCNITRGCILHLVNTCRKLKDLRLLNCCLSEEVLYALAESDREPLHHLAITCRSDEKYNADISSKAWRALATHLPKLQVTLKFDHTCPLNKVSQIMKPEIPCVILKLETFTALVHEIRLATNFYHKTLEKVVIHARPSQDLNEALLLLSDKCTYLKALYVYCILDKETIECILEKHPKLKENGNYILRHEVGADGVWMSNSME